jgi:hypothetical protein
MRGNALTTPRNHVDDDAIPEFDFSRGIPNPFAGLIGPNYRIYSHGEGPDRQAYAVISARRRGREWIEFVDLKIAPRRAARFQTEWVARETIGRFLGIDSSSFDLIIEVKGGDST